MQDKWQPPLQDLDIMDFTPFRLAVAARLISEEIANVYKDHFQLTIPEWRVLAFLAQHGRASVRDIENHVAMEKSKVSRATDRLKDRDLVTKNTDSIDRRLLHIELTQEGRALMRKLIPMVRELQAKIEAELGDEFAGLEAGLAKILARQND